jgi:hypothetical protein
MAGLSGIEGGAGWISRRFLQKRRPPSKKSRRGFPVRSSKGNWTISLRSVTPDALWEASEIVADIQDAYDLCAAA